MQRRRLPVCLTPLRGRLRPRRAAGALILAAHAALVGDGVPENGQRHAVHADDVPGLHRPVPQGAYRHRLIRPKGSQPAADGLGQRPHRLLLPVQHGVVHDLIHVPLAAGQHPHIVLRTQYLHACDLRHGKLRPVRVRKVLSGAKGECGVPEPDQLQSAVARHSGIAARRLRDPFQHIPIGQRRCSYGRGGERPAAVDKRPRGGQGHAHPQAQLPQQFLQGDGIAQRSPPIRGVGIEAHHPVVGGHGHRQRPALTGRVRSENAQRHILIPLHGGVGKLVAEIVCIPQTSTRPTLQLAAHEFAQVGGRGVLSPLPHRRLRPGIARQICPGVVVQVLQRRACPYRRPHIAAFQHAIYRAAVRYAAAAGSHVADQDRRRCGHSIAPSHESCVPRQYAGHPACAAYRLQAPQTVTGEAYGHGTQAG